MTEGTAGKPPTDLRTFIELLDESGDFLRLKKPVNTKHVIASLARKSELQNGPALLFEKPEGYEIPIVVNILSTIDRLAVGLGINKEQAVSTISHAMKTPVQPTLTKHSRVKEKVYENDFDMLKLLPIPIHSELDGGPFISGAVVFCKDPVSSRQNLSYHRMHVKGPKKLGIDIDPWRHMKDFYESSQGKPLEIAICIGLPPAIEVAGAARVPYDEIQLAGALLGKPVEMVKCDRVDLEIPACTEILVEGAVLHVKEPEGPFAEFNGYYGAETHPIVDVKAVSFRQDAIFRTICGGSMEHLLLGNVVTRDPLLYDHVKHVCSGVKAVHNLPHAAGFHAVVSIKKTKEGEAKNVIFAAFASHVNLKQVTVVDDDVDIFDPKDVEWAVATRVQPDEDIFIVPGALGHTLDKSAKNGVSAKIGIDATIPFDKKKDFVRIKYWNLDKIELKDYM